MLYIRAEDPNVFESHITGSPSGLKLMIPSIRWAGKNRHGSNSNISFTIKASFLLPAYKTAGFSSFFAMLEVSDFTSL
jgi:hypothetical protein